MRTSRHLFFVLALVGCMGAPGVFAINPLTGEVRQFPSEGEVPAGWVACSGEDSCPEPNPCAGLDEASCLARTDCSPLYVGVGAYPRECDGPTPPDLCTGMGYAGCTLSTETCTPAECGPAPGAPAYLCPDGSIGGNTGRCVRNFDGVCGWEFRECPTPTECTPTECGPQPLLPNMECTDGTVGGPTGRCIRGADGACGWEIHYCPDPCAGVPQCALACPPGTHNPVDANGCTLSCQCEADECAVERCGPPLGLPTIMCSDGSIGGNTGRCLANADGTCGWEIRECPDPCAGIPACRLACPPGTHNPVDANGCTHTCECVPDDCTERECGSPPDSPTIMCSDGSIGGNTGRCFRNAAGVCGWEWRECPPADCREGECGPPLRAPTILCSDGSIGGNTGRCLREADGVCRWELRECPDPCAGIPVCRLACPPGTHNPTDAAGCVHTCECVPDDTDTP